MGFLGDFWGSIQNLGSKVNTGLNWLGNKVIKPVAHYTGLEYLAKPVSYILDKTAEGARWLGKNTIGDTATAVLETGWSFTPFGAGANALSAGAGVVSGRHELGLGTILDIAGGAGKVGKLGQTALTAVKSARGASRVASSSGKITQALERAGESVGKGIGKVRDIGTRVQARAEKLVETNITKPLLATRAGKIYTKADELYTPYRPYVDTAKTAKNRYDKAITAQRALTRGSASATTNETFTSPDSKRFNLKPLSVSSREGVPNVYSSNQGIRYGMLGGRDKPYGVAPMMNISLA
jgi:hypothetical protein